MLPLVQRAEDGASLAGRVRRVAMMRRAGHLHGGNDATSTCGEDNALDAVSAGGSHPKGQSRFDDANLFRKADPETATAPGRLHRQIDAEAVGVERKRLLEWVWFGGLSATGHPSNGTPPDVALAMARIAAAQSAI